MCLHSQPPSKLLMAPDPCVHQPELPFFLQATGTLTHRIWFHKAPELEHYSSTPFDQRACTKAKEETYTRGFHDDSTLSLLPPCHPCMLVHALGKKFYQGWGPL